MSHIKPIAFYLPQFYATPYNDEWWGEGFTEWTNVLPAKPLFKEHYQPHLPKANDGYLDTYNQTELATLKAQIKLAKEYGVYGFCHYYYWFGGKRVLEKPTDLMLANPDVNMPFCLCWANENWSRRWDGQESHVLIAQDYDPNRYDEFAKDLAPYLSDPRYITASGKALFLIYRPDEIPDLPRLVKAIKKQAKACGHKGAMVVGAETFIQPGHYNDPRESGMDGAVEFPPHGVAARMYYLRDSGDEAQSRQKSPEHRKPAAKFEGRVFDAFEAYSGALERPVPDYPLFRSAFPSWDNTARRKTGATVFAGSSPNLFKHWVRALSDWTVQNGDKNAPFVFINAWNEWAEGAHLEPDHVYDFDYLTALRDGINPDIIVDHPFNWADQSVRGLWKYREAARADLGCMAGLSDLAARMKATNIDSPKDAPFWLDLIDLSYLAFPEHAPKDSPLPDLKQAGAVAREIKQAGSWHEAKTSLWRRFNHPHPKTPWQKFTTWVFQVVLKKG